MNILYAKHIRGFYGGEKQTEELIRGLQKRGHSLTLLTLPNSEIGQKLKDIPQETFNLFPYPDKRIKSLFFLLLLPYFFIKFYFISRRIVQKYQIQLVCLQEPYEKIVCGPIFKLLKVKVCWLEVTHWEPYLRNNTIIFHLMLWSMKFCDGIIVSSESLKTKIKPYAKTTKMIVSKHALQKGEQERFFGLKNKHFPIKTIGYIGSITKIKGVFVLLDAFKELVKQGYDLKLYYAGEGEALAELKRVIKKEKLEKYVKTLGRQKAEKFYKTIDLLVVPSYFDNLPYVIQEAFAARIPVIASKVGGIPEYFNKETQEWLFKAKDIKKLTQKVQKMIKCDQRYIEKVIKENSKYYRKNFDFEKMLDETENFFTLV